MNATTTEPSIDHTLLEKVRRSDTKLIARCPACAIEGGDRTGTHYFENLTTGQWGCAAYPGDTEHRRQIFALVGVRGERTQSNPTRGRAWHEERRKALLAAEARAKLAKAASERRDAIVARWEWQPVDVWESSPQRIDCDLVEYDPRHFLQSLFHPSYIVWTGEVHHSGAGHADRWRTVAEWQDAPAHQVAPMVAPCTWAPGTVSRTGANVLTQPFVILDFDELDGRKPETQLEVESLHDAALAFTRWLHDGQKWRLAAIVATGGKSLHCWFHHPGRAALASLRDTASAFGIDAGLLGHPEHPCRLPGYRHAKTGRKSRVLWLQPI